MGVTQNTSPLGAEKITRDLEEMRDVLEKLRGLWEEEEGRLRVPGSRLCGGRWGEPCSQASGAPRPMGEQTATPSRDTGPHAATRTASPPPVLLPSRGASLEVAGSMKCQLDQRLLIPFIDR